MHKKIIVNGMDEETNIRVQTIALEAGFTWFTMTSGEDAVLRHTDAASLSFVVGRFNEYKNIHYSYGPIQPIEDDRVCTPEEAIRWFILSDLLSDLSVCVGMRAFSDFCERCENEQRT